MSPSRLRLLIALAAALAVFFFVQNRRWSGAAGAERAHKKFLGYVESRRWGKCHRMIAVEYSDRWNFDRDAISQALQDLGRQFTFALEIVWQTRSVTAADGIYEVVGTAALDGRGNPAVDLILRTARPYAAQPYTFRWKRAGLMPWSWRLESLDHPHAGPPPGYVPGNLGSLTDLF